MRCPFVGKVLHLMSADDPRGGRMAVIQAGGI